MSELVVLGETMAALTADQVGPLRHARGFGLSVAGSESTVAIGVRRLGHTAAWVGRVGADELGELVTARLRAEDLRVHATVDPDAPTGLMLKERRTADLRRVHYHRTGSAGSRLRPADLPDGLVADARVLHTSGITTALSDTALDAVRVAVATARRHGVLVSFDVNHRSQLWSADRAVAVLRPLLAAVDLLFASDDEARLLLASAETDPTALATALRGLGPDAVVVTCGAAGSVAATPDGTLVAPARLVTEVDPVGAGDSFVAGYLAALLAGEDLPTRLNRATEVAAFSVATEGDWEGLPGPADLAALRLPTGAVTR